MSATGYYLMHLIYLAVRMLMKPLTSAATYLAGHGGARAAEYVQNHIFENLAAHPKFESDTALAIAESYNQTDQDYLKSENAQNKDAGSTASTAVIVGNKLLIANVGDSRAVISRAGQGGSNQACSFLQFSSRREWVTLCAYFAVGNIQCLFVIKREVNATRQELRSVSVRPCFR
jgi:hypothetical protein